MLVFLDTEFTDFVKHDLISVALVADDGREAMDTLLRLVRRSKDAFWALVEEKGMEAEFMRAPVTVPTQSNVLHFTAQCGNTDRPDPRYNPRQLRSYSGGAMPWKK